MSEEPSQIPDFSKGDGLVAAIAQDADTGAVLMLGFMNAEAYRETVQSGRAVYYSRSRKSLWRKGEESGNVQRVEEIFVDCDGDAILLKVRQTGGACHKGYESCFFRKVDGDRLEIVGRKVFEPSAVYKDHKNSTDAKGKDTESP